MAAVKFGFGQSIVRKEDDPLLRGRGRYVADIAPPAGLHAVVLRSPHAHARFRIDATQVRAMNGVHLVLTGTETADLELLPCTVELPGAELNVPPYPVLPRNEVRHVGDAIAFVVADTLEQAKDAAEGLSVSWEELPHVIGAAEAIRPGAPAVWPRHPRNVAFDLTLGDQAATKRAFAEAAKTVSLTLVNQRVVANYLDTRGVVAEYDKQDGLTLTLSSQGPHAIRDVLTDVLHIPPEKLRVVTPDVGGGFGTKLFSLSRICLGGCCGKAAAQTSRLDR